MERLDGGASEWPIMVPIPAPRGADDRTPHHRVIERYGSHAAYVQRVSEVVRELLEARLLLPEDAARFVDAAARQDPFKA